MTNCIKRFLCLSLCLLFANSAIMAQEYKWAHGFGDGPGGYDYGRSIATDASGNVYVTGDFFGKVDFDPSSGTAFLISAGQGDVFLAKYDSVGNFLWAKSMGGTLGESGASIAVDENSNVYISGFFNVTADFDPSSGIANLISAGGNDIFIAKYDSAGNYIWAKSMGGTSGDEGKSLKVDKAGNVYVTGFFQGTADFDPSGGIANLNSSGNTDVFLAKYNSSGNYIWAKGMGGTSSDQSFSVSVDTFSNAYITGTYYNTADFDPSVGIANLTSAGSSDIFLAKYDASGNYLWANSMGGPSSDYGYSVAVDDNENTYITGEFQGTADFDPSSGIANLTAVANTDIFFAKYDASGNYDWAKKIGGSGYDRANSIIIENSAIYLSGYFYGNGVDFDPSSGVAYLNSIGGGDIFLAKYTDKGNYLWAKNMGGAGNEAGNDVALDNNGNVWITGEFEGTADFDPSVATANLTSTMNKSAYVGKYAAIDGNYSAAWATEDSQGQSDEGRSAATDANGNVYVTGFFQGTVDFDPSAGVATLSSTGGWDIYLAKYDPLGNYLWAIAMGGTDLDRGCSVAIDDNGNACVVGGFRNTADFDPSPGTANLVSAGVDDIFLAKYDASGNYLWAKNIGSTGSDIAYSVALDGSGNIYVTGKFDYTVDFDPSGGTANLTSAGSSDIFLAKYDASGDYLWAFNLDANNEEIGHSVAIDTGNHVYLTGFFNGTVDFDPSGGTANLTSAGSFDTFIAKYDSSGSYLWAKNIGGTSDDRPTGIALGMNGNISVTGYFWGTADFDPSAGTATLTSFGERDIFLANYDGLGNYKWAKQIGGTFREYSRAIASDQTGNIYLTGTFDGTADFDPSPATANLTSAVEDIYLAKYDSLGNYLWAFKISSPMTDNGYSVAVDGNNNAYITGRFQYTADFDPNAGTANRTSNGAMDIFLAKYGPPCMETDSTINPVACDSLVSPSGNYTWYVSGIYSDTVMNAVGCDSVITINATINKSTSSTISPVACDSLVSPSGIYTWYVSGMYSDTIMNASGCDSVITINATINNSTSSTINPVACDSMISPSSNYTWYVSGIYSDTVMNAAGCDSVITINATINNSTSFTINPVACDSLVSPSGNYTWYVSGIYSDTVMNAAGCDSVITINATINNSTSSTINPVACDSLVSPSGNYTWYVSGIYSDTVMNAAGCDSVITINATINNSTSFTINPVACDSLVSPSGNYTWYVSGIYSDTVMNAAGCDSVITINATINNSTSFTINPVACDSLVSPSGNYTWYVSGMYSDTIMNASGCDSVITINATINNSTSSTINPVACDSLVSPSGNYTWYVSGIYSDTVMNAAGCDSVITINATINNSTTSTINPVACDSLVSPSGNYTWYVSGIYSDTIMNASGCDSVITINATINNSTVSTINPVVCDSLVSPSGNYTWYVSGIYSDTVMNAAGCDSVITINATINNRTSFTINPVACDSLVSPSGNYTWYVSGIYSDTIMNASGCDSVITINATINNSTSSTDVVIACDSITWIDGNTYYADNNAAQHVVTNAAGCDSIITLDLTINNSYLNAANAVICGNDSIFLEGAWQSTAGTYYDTLSAVTGCDSVIETTLAVDLAYTLSANAAICDGDSIFLQGSWQTTAGVYTDSLSSVTGCDSIIETTVSINPLPPVSFTGLDTLYCNNANAVGLAGSPAGGTFSGPGISGTTFDPTSAGTGIHWITYSYTDSSGCMAADSQQVEVDLCTSTDQANLDPASIKVYPNPSSGKYNLELPYPAETEVTVINTLGQPVQTLKPDSRISLIDLSAHASGIYYLKIASGGSVVIKKLIKQ